ncbi:MAG: YwaF family protein [Firmicutes bacterium]|nr:YwaF family protein [Bacillota bacterium]
MDVFGLRLFDFGEHRRLNENIISELPFSIGMFGAAMGMLFLWLNTASFVILVLSAFFNIPFISRAIVFIFLPISLFSAAAMPLSSVMIEGSYALNSFNGRIFTHSLELGLILSIAIMHTVFFLKKKRVANNSMPLIPSAPASASSSAKKEWIAIICTLPVIIFLTMPNNFLHVFFGFGGEVGGIDLSFSHRIILYFSILIPFGIYFGVKKLHNVFSFQNLTPSPSFALSPAFAYASTPESNALENMRTNKTPAKNTSNEKPIRDKDYISPFTKGEYSEFNRYCLLFIGIATMIVYTAIFPFHRWTSLGSLPLHLCNTAMFILPICLAFRLKKVFYFTFFINVLGAFLANLMPTYAAYDTLSYTVFSYWQNHYIAFFLPLLCVALGVFERPNIKHFFYSMVFFFIYFIFVMFVNAYTGSDFFFLNGYFIIDFFPESWRRLMDPNITIHLTGYYNAYGYYVPRLMIFRYVYLLIFFGVFTVAALIMWLLYEYFFAAWDRLRELFKRKQRIQLDEIALKIKYNLKKLSDPIDKQGVDMLQLKNFSKKYGSNKSFAVEDASLEVNAGEIFGFLGPNGAGKSTIIKSLVGLQPMTSGQMLVCGFDVEKQSVETKKRIGFVPDHYALYERLTGREYINYIADLYGIEKIKRDELLTHYLNIFQMEHAFDNQMRTYSHGMKQKIAIMAALIHEPKVWILDEPLTGLDPNSIFQVKQTMREHADKGNIVFFSSHIMDVAERICDRVAVIRKGKIVVGGKRISEIEKLGISLEHFYMFVIKHGREPESKEEVENEGLELATIIN